MNKCKRTGHWTTVLLLIALAALAEAPFAQNISEVSRSVPESQIIEGKRALELLGTSDVLKVQTFLKDQGFDVPLDGKLGGRTREAFDNCMNNGSMCGFFLLEKIVEEYAGGNRPEQEPEEEEAAEGTSGKQNGQRCKIEGDGIVPIVRSIKNCMQQPVLKNVTEPSSDNCEAGSNSPACRTKAACDRNQKSRECVCGQDKNSDECKLAEACEGNPYGPQCQCGKNPLGKPCQVALACEKAESPKECRCREISESPECKSITIVDPPPGGPSDEGDSGPPEEDIAGPDEPESGPESSGGKDATAGSADEGGREGGDETVREEEGEPKDSEEDLDALARQCTADTEEMTRQARATPKPRAKAAICRNITERGLQCLNKLDQSSEVMKAHGLEHGANSFKTSSAWNCYCHYSQAAIAEELARTSDAPMRRFELLKEMSAEHRECMNYWYDGSGDERMAPRPGLHSSGGSGRGPNATLFGAPFSRMPFPVAMLGEHCKSITRQLRDQAERAFKKEDHVAAHARVGTWCFIEWQDGLWPEHARSRPRGSDPYGVKKSCKDFPELSECKEAAEALGW